MALACAPSISSVLQRTLRHALGYGFSVGLAPLISLALLPVYTRHLSAEGMGVLALLLVSSGVLSFLYDLGMINALFRRYFEHEAALMDQRRTVLSTAWLFQAIHAAAWTTVLLTTWPAVVPSGLRAHLAGGIVPLMLVSTMLTSWADVPTAALRIHGRVRAFVTMAAVRSMGLLAASLWFVVVQGRGLAGVFESQLLVGAIALLVVIGLTHREFNFRGSRQELWAMLKFGLPFFPALFFSWAIDSSNRYFLGGLGTLQDVAVYSVSAKLGQIPMLAIKAFMVAWIPLMFSLAKTPRAPQTFATVWRYYSAGVWWLGLALSLWAGELIALASTAPYQAGASVIPVVVLACIGYGCYSFMLSGLLVTKDVWVQPVTLGTAAALNALLNWWWIPAWGMWGAAWATVASYWLAASLTWWAAQRKYPMPVRVSWQLVMASGAIAAYVVSCWWALPWFGRAVLWVSYGALLWRVGLLLPHEWQPRNRGDVSELVPPATSAAPVALTS